jgi:hypothetical protein
MSAEAAEIVIEPYKKIVIHEVIENRFPDLVNAVLNEARAAGGTTIPQLSWCGGIVFQVFPFSAESEAVIKAQLQGTIHYSNVTFAVKEKYEKEVRMPEGSVFLVDESANLNFVRLAEKLRERARFKN